jgi:hypothetical protein
MLSLKTYPLLPSQIVNDYDIIYLLQRLVILAIADIEHHFLARNDIEHYFLDTRT